MIKKLFYFHTRERNTLILLLFSTIIYSISSPLAQKWSNSDINILEVLSLNYSTIGLRISDCHQANLLELEDLLDFGMEVGLAERWIKYRQRVGGYFKAEDFQNVWGLNDQNFKVLAAHLEFRENPYLKNSWPIQQRESPNDLRTAELRGNHNSGIHNGNKIEKATPTIQAFCINSALAEEFQVIKGIGPVLSERIIRYRERLGGFFSTDQLKEVFGLDEEIIDNNIAYFQIRDTITVQLNWPEEEFRKILSHPYLDYDQVVCIMQVRRSNQEENLQIRMCFTESEWSKVKWYLKGHVKE